MNISDLFIPKTSEEMIEVAEEYYDTFYLEFIRVSNDNLKFFVEDFLEIITILSKSSISKNYIRAAIGIISLHRFGYTNFSRLSRIFDRLVPKTEQDLEYIKFTSWCAGRLVCHPDLEQSKYVRHLFERALDWTRSYGRRSRPLSAAYMISSLSMNAGNTVAASLPSLQTAIWHLLSLPKKEVLKATVDAISKFTSALVRYGRSELSNYLSFFVDFSIRLLDYGYPINEYAALIVLEQLIHQCPEYFTAKLDTLFLRIQKIFFQESTPLNVKSSAFSTLATLSIVDPKVYEEKYLDEGFLLVPNVLFNEPIEIAKSLALLCFTFPNFMKKKLNTLKKIAYNLIDKPDASFILLNSFCKTFKEFYFNEKYLETLVTTKITIYYQKFFVNLFSFPEFLRKYPSIVNSLGIYLESELKLENIQNQKSALLLLAELPSNSISNRSNLLDVIMKLAQSKATTIRKVVPRALFNTALGNDFQSTSHVIDFLLQLASTDSLSPVRAAALDVLLSRLLFQKKDFS